MIDRHFLRQQQETPWGYQLPYMLSGMFNVHPNYSSDLVARREYAIEDIWKALQIIQGQSSVGFSKDLLEDLIERGLVGSPVAKGRVRTPPSKNSEIEEPLGEASYVNRHAGRDFIVLGNGPTLRDHAAQIGEFIERYDPVVLGANFLGGLFAAQYHAFNNKRRFVDYVGQVDADSKLLLGSNFDQAFIREHTDRDFEALVFKNRVADFSVSDGVISTNCRTISTLLCGVALVMGAQRIFVVGMDGYIGLDTAGCVHWYEEADETTDPEFILEKHHSNYHYLDQINEYGLARGIEGIHILTPTGYAKFYKGISNYLELAVTG